MPEGPEIKRAADRISKALIGKEIISGELNYIIKDVVVDSSKRGFVLKQNSENFWVYT